MSSQTPGEAIQRVGQVLYNVLASENAGQTQLINLSNDCRQALQRMAGTGAPLHQALIDELHYSGALAYCATRVSASTLNELRLAVGAAASSGGAMELMALWSVVHEATKDALAEHYDELKGAAASTAVSSVVAVKDSTESIGKLLLLAFSSSMALSAEVSVELHNGVKEMADRGTPLAAHLVQELKSHSASVADALLTEKLRELQTLCSQSFSSEWGDLQEFASQIKSSVAQLADSQLVDAMENRVVDVFNSPLTKEIVHEGLSNVDKAFTQSRESIESGIAAMAGGSNIGAWTSFLASLPPLLRFEILRDFCQTVSLFFTNLYGTTLDNQDSPIIRDTHAFFRAIYDVVSANFSELWSAKQESLIDIEYVVLLVLILVGYICFLWFAISGRHLYKRSDEIRHGHEGTTWAQLAQTQQTRAKIFTWVITACLTIYLPLTRLSVEILVAAITANVDLVTGAGGGSSSSSTATAQFSTLHIKERYGDHPIWPFLQVLAVVLLVTFTLPLPFMLIKAIKENKPTGSLENPLVTYDLDGEQVPFDEKVYARLVAKDPAQLRCPYRSLYAGFGNKWRSYYKVFQLLFKVALILPLIAVPQGSVRGVITASIYSLIVLVTSYSTPFSDPLNNLMEISGKVAALVTCLGGAILAFGGLSTKLQSLIGSIVNIVNIVNLVFMVGIFLFGMRQTRRFIKNWLGTLTFSDTVRDIQDAPARSIVPKWDLEKEAKHRLWQAFWKSVLLLLKDEQLVQRFTSLEQAVLASGIHNIQRHWDGQRDEYVANMRMAARLMLEGVDVYWNDPTGTRDGHLDSKTCFGKMYIQPYPFHCVMVYDDAKDETIIRDDKFSEFLFVNFSLLVMNKRLVRQKLRALSAVDEGVQIHFPFAKQEHVTVEDGTVTRTTTDANGNTQTRTETRYTSVEFTCYYTLGVISVHPNGKDTKDPRRLAMTGGFNVFMTYQDGVGDAVAPHTGRTHHQTNRVAKMGPEHLGLTHEMLESAQLQFIFAQTQGHWVPALAKSQEEHWCYRQQLIQKHGESNEVLGDGFWFFVYNNPYLRRADLEQYLATQETNPLLRNLPASQAATLGFLFRRMELINFHATIKFWFVFWEDVFARNGDMTQLQPFKDELDPLKPDSICYRVMKREELEAWLVQRKLRRRPRCSRNEGLFRNKLVQLLYEQLQRYAEPNNIIIGEKGFVQEEHGNRVRPL